MFINYSITINLFFNIKWVQNKLEALGGAFRFQHCAIISGLGPSFVSGVMLM